MSGQKNIEETKEANINILGAGIAGLTSAINLAIQGFNVTVYEKNNCVGSKFNGDFQGLENWTSDKDIISFLNEINIDLNFEYEPFFESYLYDSELNRYTASSKRASFYLIRRGSFPGALDYGLYETALKNNVKFKFGSKETPSKIDIIATGSRSAYLKATGFVFKTNISKIAMIIFDNKIAPQGYAYFLSVNGYATIAVVTTMDIEKINNYLSLAIDTFKSITDFEMSEKKKFGGYGTIFEPSMFEDIRVGEAGGFQDGMWGFGIRLALYTGYLSAISIIQKKTYRQLISKDVIPLCKTSVVNRYFYNKFSSNMYKYILKGLSQSSDPIKFINKLYSYSFIKKIFYPLAKKVTKGQVLLSKKHQRKNN